MKISQTDKVLTADYNPHALAFLREMLNKTCTMRDDDAQPNAPMFARPRSAHIFGSSFRTLRRSDFAWDEDEVFVMISAHEALARLRHGNERFVAGVRALEALMSATRRAEVAAEQHPFAIVLGCSDSRVPAELIFDQGLGDLFVIRVAGNIVAPSQVGSVEFAAERFGTRLVVVLGHTQCGAVLATLEEVRRRSSQSPNLRSIVDRIRPAVETLIASGLGADDDRMVREAVRANVRASADHLRHGSALLEQLIQDDRLLVVGAEYSLETGVVDFFDGVTANPARET